jgi:hypothetical protein
MGGVPGHWRTLTSDSDRNPEFLRVWTEEFDALSPWTVGRYGNEEDAERWGKEKVKPDFDFLKQRGDEGNKRVDYIPVVLPGGSVSSAMQEWFVVIMIPLLLHRAIIYLADNGDSMPISATGVTFSGNKSMLLDTPCGMNTMKAPHSCPLSLLQKNCQFIHSSTSSRSMPMATRFHQTGTCA